MFGRYRRKVPADRREFIKRHRLPKPDWYVGSAESVHIDPALQAEIDELKARIDEHRRQSDA